MRTAVRGRVICGGNAGHQGLTRQHLGSLLNRDIIMLADALGTPFAEPPGPGVCDRFLASTLVADVAQIFQWTTATAEPVGGEIGLWCTVCEAGFVNQRQLSAHLNWAHRILDPKRWMVETPKCPACEREFSTLKFAKDHLSYRPCPESQSAEVLDRVRAFTENFIPPERFVKKTKGTEGPRAPITLMSMWGLPMAQGARFFGSCHSSSHSPGHFQDHAPARPLWWKQQPRKGHSMTSLGRLLLGSSSRDRPQRGTEIARTMWTHWMERGVVKRVGDLLRRGLLRPRARLRPKRHPNKELGGRKKGREGPWERETTRSSCRPLRILPPAVIAPSATSARGVPGASSSGSRTPWGNCKPCGKPGWRACQRTLGIIHWASWTMWVGNWLAGSVHPSRTWTPMWLGDLPLTGRPPTLWRPSHHFGGGAARSCLAPHGRDAAHDALPMPGRTRRIWTHLRELRSSATAVPKTLSRAKDQRVATQALAQLVHGNGD